MQLLENLLLPWNLNFAMPGSAKLKSLFNKEVTVLTIKLRDLISEGRRFTICLDG